MFILNIDGHKEKNDDNADKRKKREGNSEGKSRKVRMSGGS